MPGIATIAQESDLVVYEGDALDLFYWEEDETTGATTDVTGATARFRAVHYEKDGDETEFLDLTVGAGITIETRTISAVNIKGLAVRASAASMVRGIYRYDIKVTVSGGTASTWDAGSLVVKRSPAAAA